MGDKNKVLILVTDKSQAPRACTLYDKLCAGGKSPLILGNLGVGIESKNYPFRSIYFYQDIFKINCSQVSKDADSLFRALADKEVKGGVTLRQLTSYKGVPFWDLNARYINAELGFIIYDINMAQAILDYEQPKEIYAMDNKDNLSKIFYLLCSDKRIFFSTKNKIRLGRYSGIDRVNIRFLSFLKRIKKLLIACYYSAINLKKSLYLKNTYKIIFFAPLERHFLQIAPIVLKYSEKERLVINFIPGNSDKELKENKILYLDFAGYNPFSYFNPGIRSVLNKVRDSIYKNNIFTTGLTYKDLDIGLLLREIFEKAFYEKFPEELRKIDIVRKIILAYKPKAVVLSDNSYDLALILKSMSVPIVAIQIGHPRELIYYAPCVTDAVIVEGDYWKEYLIKNGVDTDKIIITGPPKFDFLHNNRVSPIGSVNRVSKSDGKSKKIIMFATMHSEKGMEIIDYERLNQTKSIFSTVKNIKEAHLIVKLHPFDANPDVYRRIAREVGLLDYTIIDNLDASKLLYLCDLVITHYSRVSYEAVLMNKNVIILNQSSTFDSEDIWDFKRYGVVIGVENFNELERHIFSALFDPQVSFDLMANRKQYIYEHAYKIDGNAADRAKEVIDRFL